MSYSKRIPLYKEIEKIRDRPLIVYVTSYRPQQNGIMAQDVIPEICEQMNQIPSDVNSVDLLLVSYGGNPIVAWRIISLLRERFKKVGVLLPFVAQSAATVLAFGADEIVMHPYSCLGPIDPQITTPVTDIMTPPRTFSVEDVKSFLEFLDETEDTDVKNFALKHLVEILDPITIGVMKKSIMFSDSIAEKLLRLHLDDDRKIQSILDKFNNLANHSYTVSRTEALESGLPVICPETELEELMWNIWIDLEDEMKCRVPITPANMFLGDSKIKHGVLTSAKTGTIYADEKKESAIAAVVESKMSRSVFRTEVEAFINSNGINIQYSMNAVSLGWVREH